MFSDRCVGMIQTTQESWHLSGNPKQAAEARRKANQASQAADKQSKHNLQTATGLFLHSLGSSQPEQAAPAWFNKLGQHHALYHVNGMAFCAKCGGVSASETGSPLLAQDCKGILPPGSRSRLARVAKGLHPYKHQAHWPDGTPSSTTGKVRRVQGSVIVGEEVDAQTILALARVELAPPPPPQPAIAQPPAASHVPERGSLLQPDPETAAHARPARPRVDRTRFRW